MLRAYVFFLAVFCIVLSSSPANSNDWKVLVIPRVYTATGLPAPQEEVDVWAKRWALAITDQDVKDRPVLLEAEQLSPFEAKKGALYAKVSPAWKRITIVHATKALGEKRYARYSIHATTQPLDLSVGLDEISGAWVLKPAFRASGAPLAPMLDLLNNWALRILQLPSPSSRADRFERLSELTRLDEELARELGDFEQLREKLTKIQAQRDSVANVRKLLETSQTPLPQEMVDLETRLDADVKKYSDELTSAQTYASAASNAREKIRSSLTKLLSTDVY